MEPQAHSWSWELGVGSALPLPNTLSLGGKGSSQGKSQQRGLRKAGCQLSAAKESCVQAVGFSIKTTGSSHPLEYN